MNVTHRLQSLGTLLLALTASCGPAAPRAASTLDPWPFTANVVTLSCEPAAIPASADEAARRTLRQRGSRVFVTTEDGHRYAANGAARGEAPLMRDIQATTDTTDLIQLGLSLCRNERGGSLRLERPHSPAEPEEVAGPPTYTFGQAELHGYFATAQSDQVINGKRPELTLACERGHAPMVMLDLVEAPPVPPPLRGVYAEFQVGAAAPQRIEMSWATDEDWTLRSGDDRAEDAALVREILSEGSVTFTGASRYMPSSPIRWNFAAFGDDLPRIRRECLNAAT